MLEEDRLLEVLPIHLSNALAPNLYVHQFPLLTRSLQVPPSAVSAGKRISARIKPGVRRIEIHVPTDTRPEVYNADRGKQFGVAQAEDDREKNQEIKANNRDEAVLADVRLRSEQIPQRGVHMLGVVRDGHLRLHPISETHQLRPTLTYLNILSRKARRSRAQGGSDSDSDDGPPPDPDEPPPLPKAKKKTSAGEAKEVQVSARRADDKGGLQAVQGSLSAARREMLHLIRVEEEEAWEDLEVYDFMTGESSEVLECIFSRNGEELECKTDITTFLKGIDGL